MRKRSVLIAALVILLAGGGLVWWHQSSSAAPAPLIEGTVTGAQLTWDAGLNSSRAKSTVSLDAAAPTRLARLINAAPLMPDGPIACPMDDGSNVTAIFDRLHAAVVKVVIRLTGCAGPGDRLMSDELSSELNALAPQGFRITEPPLLHGG